MKRLGILIGVIALLAFLFAEAETAITPTEQIKNDIALLSEATLQTDVEKGKFQENLGLVLRDVHAKNADPTLRVTTISPPMEIIGNAEYLKFVTGGADVRGVTGHYLIPVLSLAVLLVFLFTVGSLPRISEYAEIEKGEEDYTYWKKTRAA